LVLFSTWLLPSGLFAKGSTTRIVIEGPDLTRPIEITDRAILKNFSVWAGPGVFRRPETNPDAPSLIIDWSQGAFAEIPQSARKYQVSFYTEDQAEQPVYVVYYAVSDGLKAGAGYVYLPGKSDEWYRLNTRSLVRGVEGKWFRARNFWDGVARPLIDRARSARSRHARTALVSR